MILPANSACSKKYKSNSFPQEHVSFCLNKILFFLLQTPYQLIGSAREIIQLSPKKMPAISHKQMTSSTKSLGSDSFHTFWQIFKDPILNWILIWCPRQTQLQSPAHNYHHSYLKLKQRDSEESHQAKYFCEKQSC